MTDGEDQGTGFHVLAVSQLDARQLLPGRAYPLQLCTESDLGPQFCQPRSQVGQQHGQPIRTDMRRGIHQDIRGFTQLHQPSKDRGRVLAARSGVDFPVRERASPTLTEDHVAGRVQLTVATEIAHM